VTVRSAAVAELAGWAMQRGRRVQTRTATKNQLLAQLDRCFPGLTMVLPDVLGTKVGRLVAAEFADPHRLAALGVTRFVRFAANRGLRVRRSTADRLVAAARGALPCPESRVARQVLADDLVLLGCLDVQITAVEAKLARLLADTPFAPLTTVTGWGTVRAASYGAAVGDLTAGREPASSTAPPVYHLRSMSRLGSVVTAASAARAAWRCGGR